MQEGKRKNIETSQSGERTFTVTWESKKEEAASGQDVI